MAIILTGVTGSGKSEAGNFFVMRPDAFKSGMSFNPITAEAKTHTLIFEDKRTTRRISITDTRGLLEDQILDSEEDHKALADYVYSIPLKVNAIAFVIASPKHQRVTAETSRLLEKLLAKKEMIPYVFLIFTSAADYGKTEEDQQKECEMLLGPQRCPKILQELLKRIKNRYMLLESVVPMGQGYHQRKRKELIQIVQEIMKQNCPQPSYCSTQNSIGELMGKVQTGLTSTVIEELQVKIPEFESGLCKMLNDNKQTVIIVIALLCGTALTVGFIYRYWPLIKIAGKALAKVGYSMIDKITELKPTEISTYHAVVKKCFSKICTIEHVQKTFEATLSAAVNPIYQDKSLYVPLAFGVQAVFPSKLFS